MYSEKKFVYLPVVERAVKEVLMVLHYDGQGFVSRHRIIYHVEEVNELRVNALVG